MTLGIRGKLFFLSVALVVAALVATEVLLAPGMERLEIDRSREELLHLATASRDLLDAAAPHGEIDALAKRLTQQLGVRVTYIAADGRVLGDGDVAEIDLARVENHRDRPEVAAALRGEVGVATRVSATVGVQFLYLALPPAASGVVTRAAMPLVQVARAKARLNRALLGAALGGLLVAAFLSTLAAQMMARPLREMTAVARALAERRFTTRAPADSHDELGDLARALNTLSIDLDRSLSELTRERDLLGAVLNAMNEGVLVTDRQENVLRSNPALTELLGVAAPAEGEGRRTVLEVTRHAELARHIAEVTRHHAAASAEVEFTGPPARLFLVSSAPFGGDRGAVTVFHDVTDLRRLERVRRDFVANVSHELRTPVATLQAAGETLLAGALRDPEKGPEFLDIIARNAERLGTLVTDLLALARLDAGELSLRSETVLLRAVADTVLPALSARLRERRLGLEDRLDPALSVLGDPRALEQVLSNLLDNACKYAIEGGTIGLDAAREGEMVRLQVWDTGPGIEPHHQARVFERFYRVDPGRSRALGGTGLGLAIVRHLVENMGGRVGVESRPGGGSVFWFTLPVG